MLQLRLDKTISGLSSLMYLNKKAHAHYRLDVLFIYGLNALCTTL